MVDDTDKGIKSSDDLEHVYDGIQNVETTDSDVLKTMMLSCMTCVVNFVFVLSQLQGVEWGWLGRREPDDEHSPAS